jgi:hypothetical protein
MLNCFRITKYHFFGHRGWVNCVESVFPLWQLGTLSALCLSLCVLSDVPDLEQLVIVGFAVRRVCYSSLINNQTLVKLLFLLYSRFDWHEERLLACQTAFRAFVVETSGLMHFGRRRSLI